MVNLLGIIIIVYALCFMACLAISYMMNSIHDLPFYIRKEAKAVSVVSAIFAGGLIAIVLGIVVITNLLAGLM